MTKTKQKKKETTATITMPIDCTGATINMEKDWLAKFVFRTDKPPTCEQFINPNSKYNKQQKKLDDD